MGSSERGKPDPHKCAAAVLGVSRSGADYSAGLQDHAQCSRAFCHLVIKRFKAHCLKRACPTQPGCTANENCFLQIPLLHSSSTGAGTQTQEDKQGLVSVLPAASSCTSSCQPGQGVTRSTGQCRGRRWERAVRSWRKVQRRLSLCIPSAFCQRRLKNLLC